MPTFRYSTGSSAATIEAPDRASALRQLTSKGIAPSAFEELSARQARAAASLKPGMGAGGGATGAVARTARGKLSLSQTSAFIRELQTALSAGLPLIPALRTLKRSRDRSRSRTSAIEASMLAHLISEVEQGKSLAEACGAWGQPFDELQVNLLRAGEASGKLSDVMVQDADLLDRSLALRRSILSATIYPLMLTVLVTIAIVVVSVYIVPTVLKPLADNNVPLPWPTLVVKGFTDFITGYWYVVLGLIALGALGFRALRANPSSRLAMDGMLIRVPLLGPMLVEAAVARFTRTLGTLVTSGLPLLTALRLSTATITNNAMRKAAEAVADEVQAGKTIAEPMEKAGFFPPLLVQVVSLGERSGRLPELLNQAAVALEDRTQMRVRLFSEALRPILVVLIAFVVAFVVAAILFALLAMQDAIGGPQ
jgi:type II secretory pathway component PulF